MASRANRVYSCIITLSRSTLFASSNRTCFFATTTRAMSSKNTLDLAGVYPPIATPFNSEEEIAWDKLKANLEKWGKIPFRGYVVQGSNGEYAYLNQDERVAMVKFVKEQVPAGKLVIAGSGCESTRDTIWLTKNMAKAGADAVMVVSPSYYKNQMTTDALEKHFIKVADNSPVPVILYSVPANTGFDIPPESVVKLSQHKNIIGLKDSGGDISRIGNLVYRTQESGFQILAGSAGFLYPALAIGCVGGVCALANMLGNEVCQVETLFKAGKLKEVKELQHRLVAPNGAVTRRFGVPGLKAAMEWFGYYGGPLRMPLQPLTSQQADIVKQDFKRNGFLS